MKTGGRFASGCVTHIYFRHTTHELVTHCTRMCRSFTQCVAVPIWGVWCCWYALSNVHSLSLCWRWRVPPLCVVGNMAMSMPNVFGAGLYSSGLMNDPGPQQQSEPILNLGCTQTEIIHHEHSLQRNKTTFRELGAYMFHYPCIKHVEVGWKVRVIKFACFWMCIIILQDCVACLEEGWQFWWGGVG